ncbi:MAG: hypothetical protein DMG36_16455 [Acidobacteria bacterium]|nr:MAG: hypothetical protein DMG36_16455 [Acidobacteriota bacterium]
MPPIIKDSDTVTTARETARNGSAAAAPGDSAIKQQPVALEIPITVNGARTMEGTDKREPFSESTKTVMVFGSGAVIRLNSTLAPGQLLFLTNDRSKKEVVCQVVKSKNYRNVSGYVELEFTEPAVGFWGMRFPSDRIGPGPQAAPATPAAGNGSVAPGRPAAQKVEQPAANGSSSTVAVKPSSPAPVPSKPVAPAASSSSFVPAPLDSATLLGAPKSKRDSGVATAPVAPIAKSLDSDAPLVEPWLKKREPVSKVPAAPPAAAPPALPAKPAKPVVNLATTPNFDLARPSDKPASLFAPTEAPSNPAMVDLSSLAPFFEVKPAPADVPPPPPPPQAPASDPETEDLKQHTAHLQDELATMPFAEPAASWPARPEVETPSFPLSEQAISAIKTDLVHDSAAQLIEDSGASNASLLPDLPAIEEPARDTPPATITTLGSLDQEEMKIPAWLEPLARNTAAPASTQEPVLREKAKRVAEQTALHEMMAPLAAPIEEERAAESRVPQFGSALPFEEVKSARESSPKKSGKGTLFGAVAAGILVLAGGGWWYMNQQSGGVHASVPTEQAPAVSAASQDAQPNSVKGAALESMLPIRRDAAASQPKPAGVNSNAQSNSASNPSGAAPAGSTAVAAHNSQAGVNSLNGGNVVSRATSTTPEVEPVQEKKPVLGEVHLATPKIAHKRTVQGSAEPDAGISLNEDQPEANADSLGAGLGITNNQPAAPAAPVAVGGDVRQAKLITSVPPVYPALAKTQHVSGGVTIDALIDASGRVTTMKVISGPTLLQQAAMDALKQWKYQPATLNGTAVPMHLTVTIQFRLQ